MSKELSLGEQIPYKGMLLEVRESEILCKGCIYQGKNCSSVRKDIGPCRSNQRIDKKDVVYADVSSLKEYKITVQKNLKFTLNISARSYSDAIDIAKKSCNGKFDEQELNIY